MRIENWSLVVVGKDETQSLSGQVFGNPKFNDGQFVTTSRIVGKNSQNEVITKSGNSYELGQIKRDYEAEFPGARNRLLDNLTLYPTLTSD